MKRGRNHEKHEITRKGRKYPRIGMLCGEATSIGV